LVDVEKLLLSLMYDSDSVGCILENNRGD